MIFRQITLTIDYRQIHLKFMWLNPFEREILHVFGRHLMINLANREEWICCTVIGWVFLSEFLYLVIKYGSSWPQGGEHGQGLLNFGVGIFEIIAILAQIICSSNIFLHTTDVYSDGRMKWHIFEYIYVRKVYFFWKNPDQSAEKLGEIHSSVASRYIQGRWAEFPSHTNSLISWLFHQLNQSSNDFILPNEVRTNPIRTTKLTKMLT